MTLGHTWTKIIGASALLASCAELPPSAAEVGVASEALVGGQLVSEETQHELRLLTLFSPRGSCSASLLNDHWAITAHHCVDGFNANQIQLRSNWPGKHKTAAAVQLITFADNDIALVGTLDFGSTPSYSMPLHTNGLLQNLEIEYYGRGISQFATPTTTSVSDGLYRTALFGINSQEPNAPPPTTYSFTSVFESAYGAGGDSGGPSYIWAWDKPESPDRKWERQLVGVHSTYRTRCAEGQTCPQHSWTWVAAVTSNTDAAVLPLRAAIENAIQALPNNGMPAPGFPSGGPTRFGRLFYATTEDGELYWMRHYDEGEPAWEGPRPVGSGWNSYSDVFSAGGYSIYGRKPTGELIWSMLDSFNNVMGEQVPAWKGPLQVATGWEHYARVFAGGDGIMYGIDPDGTLWWNKHYDYKRGGSEPHQWAPGPVVVGSGWDIYSVVVSTGQGMVYTVGPDGRLEYYKHVGYSDGTPSWQGPWHLDSGWDSYKLVFPGVNGTLYTVRADGTLEERRHTGWNAETVDQTMTAPKVLATDWQGYVRAFTPGYMRPSGGPG